MLGCLLKSRRLAKAMDQKTLCAGICSVSYLSKIENDQADPGEDVLRLLFGRLGIADWSPRGEDDAARGLLRDYFTGQLLAEDTATLARQITALLPTLDGTALELPGRIFALYQTDAPDEARRLLHDLAPFKPYLTPAQRMLVNHMAWQLTDGDATPMLLEIEKVYPCCITALDLANSCFVHGGWQESLQWARTAFDRSVAAGCVYGMQEASLVEGGCYANLYNIPLMRAAYDRTAALSRGNERIRGHIAYNVGATLLEVGRDREALPELLHAYDSLTADTERLLTCHKLALCLARLHRRDDSEPYLLEAEALCARLDDEAWTQMIALARMRCTPGYLDNPAYGEALRAFCQSPQFPRGYIAFHERMLEEWLTHQRRYKEAYELVVRRFPDIV